MILPDGYSDVPAGKIAAVVTHLEMTELPALPTDPPGDWTLRRVETPALDWYRDLYRRVGEEWLWFSRTQMPDAELAAIIQAPLVEVYALVHDGRELRFAVHDDGRGFEPAAINGTGSGLQSLADRLGAVGGVLTIESAPGRGTRIAGTVPDR